MENKETKTEVKEEVAEVIMPSQDTATDKLLKIAVIGTGNCGCMLANDVTKALGIDGIAINGSRKDLQLLDSPKIIGMLVGDGKGTGKDRDKAKEFFMSEIGFVNDKKFIKVIESNDVIIVTTSTGGGYGSGSSTELLELLSELYKEKIFIAAGVLPFEDEGYEAFKGTKDWLREMGALNIGYMIYDNNRFKHLTPSKSAEKISEAFIRDISVLEGDWLTTTRTGGIDERDMLTVLSVPGRILIDAIDDLEVVGVVNGSIIKTIKEHITNESAHAEMVEDKEILASALMYTLGDEFDGFKSSLKSDLCETFGIHVKDPSNFADEEGTTVALVLSGLTEPAMVIDRIINKAQSLKNDIEKRKSASSKLSKLTNEEESSKLNVTAKQSFADEMAATKAQNDEPTNLLLQRFLERKRTMD